MTTLDALARQVRNAIPLTRHLDFQFEQFDGRQLTVTAPLAPNHNDKGTFFAGSQSALLTLSGWALTTLLSQQAGHPADVVAVESQLNYLKPLDTDLRLIASVSEEDADRFSQRLNRKGKAPLSVPVKGYSHNGVLVCEFTGVFLARE